MATVIIKDGDYERGTSINCAVNVCGYESSVVASVDAALDNMYQKWPDVVLLAENLSDWSGQSSPHYRIIYTNLYASHLSQDDGHIYRRPDHATLSRWQRFKSFTQRCKAATRYIIDGRHIGVPGRRWLLEKGYAYFQEFIPHEYETRVSIVGNRAWAHRRYPSPDDFGAAVRTDVDPSKIDLRCVQMTFDINERLTSQSITVDFLFHNNMQVVTEICYTQGATIMPGLWNRNLEWTPSNLTMVEAQAEDFLARISAAHIIKR